jgi:hypothetical protein
MRVAVEYGWSRNILVHQISSRLHEREKAKRRISRANAFVYGDGGCRLLPHLASLWAST